MLINKYEMINKIKKNLKNLNKFHIWKFKIY